MKKTVTAGLIAAVGAVAFIMAALLVSPLGNGRVASAQEAGAPDFIQTGQTYTVRVAGTCTSRMRVLEIQSGGWVRAEGIDGCLLRDGSVGWWNVNTGQAIKAE